MNLINKINDLLKEKLRTELTSKWKQLFWDILMDWQKTSWDESSLMNTSYWYKCCFTAYKRWTKR